MRLKIYGPRCRSTLSTGALFTSSHLPACPCHIGLPLWPSRISSGVRIYPSPRRRARSQRRQMGARGERTHGSPGQQHTDQCGESCTTNFRVYSTRIHFLLFFVCLPAVAPCSFACFHFLAATPGRLCRECLSLYRLTIYDPVPSSPKAVTDRLLGCVGTVRIGTNYSLLHPHLDVVRAP